MNIFSKKKLLEQTRKSLSHPTVLQVFVRYLVVASNNDGWQSFAKALFPSRSGIGGYSWIHDSPTKRRIWPSSQCLLAPGTYLRTKRMQIKHVRPQRRRDTVDGSEIRVLHHLLYMKSYETWDILNINWLARFLPSTIGSALQQEYRARLVKPCVSHPRVANRYTGHNSTPCRKWEDALPHTSVLKWFLSKAYLKRKG